MHAQSTLEKRVKGESLEWTLERHQEGRLEGLLAWRPWMESPHLGRDCDFGSAGQTPPTRSRQSPLPGTLLPAQRRESVPLCGQHPGQRQLVPSLRDRPTQAEMAPQGAAAELELNGLVCNHQERQTAPVKPAIGPLQLSREAEADMAASQLN